MIAILLVSIILGAHYAPELYKKNNIQFYEVGVEASKLSYKLEKHENNSANSKVEYQPNLNNYTGFTLGTRYFDISLIFEGQSTDEKEKDFDKSKAFDLQFFGARDKFIWEIYYQNYQGLYILEDKSLLDENEIPRASSFSYGASVKYFTNKDFTAEYSVGHFKKSKVTGWSYVHGFLMDKSKLYSNSGKLVPTKYADEFEQIKDVTGIETRSIGYDFGLAGMKAWESFYTSGLLSLGIIGQHQHLEGVDNEDRMLTSSTINLLVDFGYRSKNSSVGLQLRTQTFGIPVEDTEFNKSRQGGRIYFNYFL